MDGYGYRDPDPDSDDDEAIYILFLQIDELSEQVLVEYETV